MIDPRTPVLIGGGQQTWRGDPLGCPSPRDMMVAVSKLAATDAGLSEGALSGVDRVAVVGFTIDAPGDARRFPVPRMANPPKALATALGAAPNTKIYTHMGGNTPQALVNATAEAIANGETDFVLIAGAEFLGNLTKRLTKGLTDGLDTWGIADDEAPTLFGDPRDGCTPHEQKHGLHVPANVYPMFEGAYRAHLGRDHATHMKALGALFSPFSKVAAANPHAWFPTERSADEIITESPNNRMVGFPYTKYLNSIIQVDQAGAVLMASYAKAKELGVADDKMVFLHGCADTHELWNPLDRVNYYSSPAIGTCAREAFAMAGKTVAEMDFFDIYSCFPISVELACNEIGIAHDDPRGLTLTGGLPYFGGPGNNYVMHSIVEALNRARAKPGTFGLVTANGWFLTKHAMGIYSTTPTNPGWARKNPYDIQKTIDALAHPEIIEAPSGPAIIEAYTVIHDRESYRLAIIIGRDAEGRRFVANTPKEDATYAALEQGEWVGRMGTVSSADGRNVFVLPR